MADVLSQSQIDALLNSLQGADEGNEAAEEPKKVEQEYRRKTEQKFSDGNCL